MLPPFLALLVTSVLVKGVSMLPMFLFVEKYNIHLNVKSAIKFYKVVVDCHIIVEDVK
jgi:hypothetical protein